MDPRTIFLNQFSSACTKESYMYSLRLFYDHIKNKSLTTLTMDDLRRFQSTLNGGSSARRTIACIKSYFKFLYNQGFIQDNIGRCMILPKKQDVLVERDFKENQAKQLITMATKNTKLMVEFLFYLGIRISECVRIHTRDINIQHGRIRVKIHGKGGKVRYCHFGTNMSKRLQPALASLNGYIFPSRSGGHLTRNGGYKRVKKLMRKIGVDAGSPHWLRHCFASTLLEKQTNIKSISVAMGHTNIATTSCYLHVNNDMGLLDS